MRTWILSIVRHRGVDLVRSSASRRRTQDKVEAPEVKVQPSEAFSETWRNSQRNQVREALKALPSEQLKILELVFFSGYTHVEGSQGSGFAAWHRQGQDAPRAQEDARLVGLGGSLMSSGIAEVMPGMLVVFVRKRSQPFRQGQVSTSLVDYLWTSASAYSAWTGSKGTRRK